MGNVSLGSGGGWGSGGGRGYSRGTETTKSKSVAILVILAIVAVGLVLYFFLTPRPPTDSSSPVLGSGAGGPGPGPGPGNPPIRGPLPPVVARCQVSSLDNPTPNGCNDRYISWHDLDKDLLTCAGGDELGQCYAGRILKVENSPTIAFSDSSAGTRERAQYHQDVEEAVEAMARDLKKAAEAGVSNLPSIGEIDALAQNALNQVDEIDQPVDETTDQRLRRLGLRPSIAKLGRYLE